MASRALSRYRTAMRGRARVGTVLLAACLLGGAEAAMAGDGAEFSTDCSHTYVNKAVGKEQWAITWDLVSRVSGNVFKPDGGVPSFVECFRRAARDPGLLSFECFGASSCAKPPCSQKWESLGPVSVPEAFFYPKGVDPRDPKAACAPDSRVCPEGCPFSTVGEAIEALPPGSFIHVAEGAYKEILKPGGKPFTLYGEPGAVLEGMPSGVTTPGQSDVIVQLRCDESATGLRRFVGMTIRGQGFQPGASVYPYTGGIWNSGCALSIEDSIIEDNHAISGTGGGISNGGPLLIARTTFARNGGSSGGAIANSAVLDVFDGSFVENRAPAGPDRNGGGGAIINYGAGDAVIENSRFLGNATSSGCCSGGAILNQGALALSRSVIEDSQGSAITNWDDGRLTVRASRLERSSAQGGLSNEGFATIEDSILRDNSGRVAGGIVNTGEMVIRSSQLSGNSTMGVSAKVGGLLNEGTRLELDGVLFEENSCNSSPGPNQEDPCVGGLLSVSGVVVAKDLEFRDNVPRACGGVDFSCE